MRKALANMMQSSAGQKLIAYLTLKSLESQLPEKMFLKIHRSFIVNTSHIEYLEDNHAKVGDNQISLSWQYLYKLMALIQKKL